MKCKIFKRLAALGLCCAAATTFAFAANTITKTITVEYSGIKLVVDGVPVTPKDANGSTVEPFVYNGTTYLPVRAVGNAIGKEVGWDGTTQTVYLGEVPGKKSYLVDVCPPYETRSYTEYKSSEGKSFLMSGTSYSNGFVIDGDEGYALFNLNGKYSTLTFDIGHVDESYMEGRKITFVVDGQTVDEIKVGAEDLVKNCTVDLKNGLQLKIIVTDDEATSTSWVYNADIGFANAELK